MISGGRHAQRETPLAGRFRLVFGEVYAPSTPAVSGLRAVGPAAVMRWLQLSSSSQPSDVVRQTGLLTQTRMSMDMSA